MSPPKSVVEPRREVEALYNEHYPTVLRYLLRRTDPETAHDLVTEVFLVAWRRINDVPSAPAGWLCGVARRLLANERRSARRREALTERMAGQLGAHQLSVEDQVINTDDAVIAALNRLPEAEREVLMLIAWDQLTAAEAATALGCSRPTFHVKLYRARRRFEKLLAAGSPAHSRFATTPPMEAVHER